MHKVIPLFFTLLIIAGIETASAQESQRRSASLDELFKMADDNNRALKVLGYAEQLAEEEIQQQKNKLLPSVNASLAFSYNGDGWISDRDFSNGMRAPIPDFGNNFALEATQVIYAGDAIKTSVEKGKLSLLLARLDKEKNKQDIRFLIAGYYLELQKLQNQNRILVHSLQQTDKVLEQIKNKAKQGVVLKTAITRYELQKQSIELALDKIGNSERIINNELVTTVQLPAGTRLDISPVVSSTARQSDLSQWRILADENAPVLRQMQIHVQQAEHNLTLAKADKLPQLAAFAGDHFDGPVTIEVPPLNKNFNYWYVGVGLKYNVSSLFTAKSKVRASRIAASHVAENKALVYDQLLNDIESAIIRFEEAKKVYDTHLKGVQLATENYKVIRNRYLDNLVLITEMLDAENSKIDAEMKAANAQINILYHHYQLKKLSGTL